MTPADIPPLKEGDELSARWLNTLRNIVIYPMVDVDPSSGLTASTSGFVTTIGFVGDNSGLVPMWTDGGVTAATHDGGENITPGTGTAVDYTWDGTEMIKGAVALDVKNPYRDAVDANTLIWVRVWNGLRLVAQSECPPA